MTKLDNSVIQSLMKKSNISWETILRAMKKIRGNKSVNSKNAEDQYKALEKYPSIFSFN